MFRRLLSHMPLILFALAWLAIAFVLGHLGVQPVQVMGRFGLVQGFTPGHLLQDRRAHV